MMGFGKKRGQISTRKEIDPDEIFLDSENLPGYDTSQFEGRIEKPISRQTIIIVGLIFLVVGLAFTFRTFSLQIQRGEEFVKLSEQNRLRQSIIFADRGIIYDVNRTPIVWNKPPETPGDVILRQYIDKPGFSNLLGYVTYPQKDKAGFYFAEETIGVEGIEEIYNDWLSGENGSEIIETNALDETISQSTTRRAEKGEDLYLTIDADLQEHFRNAIAKIITERDFGGGGGVIMDVTTGDILAMVSFPEYDSNVLSDGKDKDKINSYINDPQKPFLNRVIHGLYTPGSVMKPFMALAALKEDIISPSKQILSTGKIVIPNPYNPDNPSVFNDWKAHGLVDMRRALAVSSNVYFYEVGGGFEDQKGLGIDNINKYFKMFGFGESLNSKEFGDVAGTIPSPEWKKEVFNDEWRVGDTYFTSIGQYGVQITPIQAVVAVAAIANEGTLVEPRLVSDSSQPAKIRRQIDIDSADFKVVKAGMRDSVLTGISQGLNYPDLEIAVKTGTAELGESKLRVNSWVTGFFPYNNPRYAFAIVLEEGLRTNNIGGVAAARDFFDWLKATKPEYTK